MPNSLGMLGKKIGMTRLYDENGCAIGVTALEIGPCVVLQVKTLETDGYSAIQLGFDSRRESRMKKPAIGHAKAAGQEGGFYHIKEFRVSDSSQYQIGQTLTMEDLFKVGDLIDISGTSKGKGFQGSIKRHNFRSGPSGHGSKHHRAPGSIGCSATPSKVVKGKKMPGQMGNARVSKKNLIIIDIRTEDNVMVVKGSVPGSKQGLIQLYTK
nr:50S ribosomal protein L3 [Desulfobulbaceae bacterium]